MRLSRDHLIRKALLVVEEACEGGRVDRSMGLRFALAYLYAVSIAKDRYPFDALWVGTGSIHHQHSAHMTEICRAQHLTALINSVYAAVGVYRSADHMGYKRRQDAKAPKIVYLLPITFGD